MKRVLLVNDDGINSPGLLALIPVLSESFDLTIVAPPSQRSWIGKASSYHKNLGYEGTTVEGVPAYVLEGTPSDCAVAGIYHLCSETPDLVISGINVGANIGDAFILSSGTVGGAMEGALAGILSVSVGLEFSHDTTKQMEFNPSKEDTQRFEFAAGFTGQMARYLVDTPLPGNISLVNLNFHEHADESSPVEITVPARYKYGSFLKKDQDGFFHGGAGKDFSRVENGSDMAAVRDGKVSVTFLDLLASPPLDEEFRKRFTARFEKKE
jgi:5'-nucleotidase